MKREPNDDLHEFEIEPSRLQRIALRFRLVVGEVSGFFVFVGDFVVWTVAEFGRNWLTSRPLRALILGLPALLVAIGAVVLAGVVHERASQEEVIARYQNAAAEALERGDADAANLWLEKTVEQNASAPVHQFHLAMVAADQGNLRKTREILQRIAPSDRAGYPEAHLWLAGDLIERELALTPEMARRIEHDLQCALAHTPTRSQTQAMLGKLYVMQQDWDRAIEHFQDAARTRPEYQMMLSKLYRRQNRPEQARQAARTAAEHFRRLADDDREHWQHFLQWALCELLAENFDTAARILERIRPRADDPKPVRESLVLAYLGWFDQVTRDEPGDMVRQLELLNRALLYGPENPRVLTLIANLSTRPLEGEEAELAQPLNDALQRALAAGVAPAVVHLILGTRQLVDGDTDNAVMHLELAHQANDQVPSVLNNLAWGLAHRDQPDLERALTLIDTAAELSDRPQIRGTRAVILNLMGKQQEAVTELEGVLRRHPDPAWVHERLADLYRRLGDESLAEEHQQLAKKAGKEAERGGARTSP